MRPEIRVLVLIVSAVLILFVLVRRWVGDVKPALLPPREAPRIEISQKQESGAPVPFPLSLPAGFRIGVFATGVQQARDLAISAGGTILVSSPNQGQVMALPDSNKDGTVDSVKTVLGSLRGPHGIAFHKDKLFVAELHRVARYSWDEKTLTATFERDLFSLPEYRGHTSHSLAINDAGTLWVSVGSSCNVCEEKDARLGTLLMSNVEGAEPIVYATGLRNAPFLAVHPSRGELWVTEMGRDFLGDDLPPDEINRVEGGKFYGWPYCYGNRVHDRSFDREGAFAEKCLRSEPPLFEIAAHSAPLGLAFIDSPQFPRDWQGDLLVAYHGSWNRSTPIGYKVVRLKVEGDSVIGEEDFITGFLPTLPAGGQGAQAAGRPVDVLFDQEGSLYVSDDKAGVVYKVVRSDRNRLSK